jgi:hypothetical protein
MNTKEVLLLKDPLAVLAQSCYTLHKRTKMTDEQLENLVFLKGNKWIADELSNCR